MKDEIVINGVTYVRKEKEKVEENKELYRIVKFSNIEWYVINEDKDTMTLLMKSKFTKDMMKKYFNNRDMDSDCNVKFSRNHNNTWRDSLIRMVLNSKFLDDLDISKIEIMEITDNNITTRDYVRLLTKDEVDNLPKHILMINDEYGYWTSSAYSGLTTRAWYVSYYGCVDYGSTSYASLGARAVVKIRKELRGNSNE